MKKIIIITTIVLAFIICAILFKLSEAKIPRQRFQGATAKLEKAQSSPPTDTNMPHLTAEDTNAMRQVWAKRNSVSFTTAAYQKEAFRQVIEEANRVAKEMNLPENLPITESNLLKAYINTPAFAFSAMGMFGNITTSNYTYYVSVDKKFSYLTKYFRDVMKEDYDELHAKYLWPMEQKDTNAAHQMALEFLASASMDTNALEKDCHVDVDAIIPEGKNGKHFIPLYKVTWWVPGTNMASVDLLYPTRELRSLRVEDTKYILRHRLIVTNLTQLLFPTNTSTTNQ